MGKLSEFFRLSGTERLLFLEAVCWCALVRLTMLLVPFRRYTSLLGTPQGGGSSSFGPSPGFWRQLEQTGAAIRRASRHVPWKTRCFVEAITARRMLKRRKIPCAIYLGLKKVESMENGEGISDLAAHAWSACGDFIITGRQGVKLEQYTVVSVFH